MSDANPVVGIMDEEIDLARYWHRRADAAEARARELDACLREARDERDGEMARVRELDAQCAAMREALKDVQYVLDHVRPFTTQVWGNPACSLEARDLEEVSETVKAALSGDAGRALLERVDEKDRRIEALERAAEEVRSTIVRPESALGDAMGAIDALERDLADKSERCRRGAHALIELIGASCPENIDETCARAAKRLEELEKLRHAVKNAIGQDGTDDWSDVFDILHTLEAKR